MARAHASSHVIATVPPFRSLNSAPRDRSKLGGEELQDIERYASHDEASCVWTNTVVTSAVQVVDTGNGKIGKKSYKHAQEPQ